MCPEVVWNSHICPKTHVLRVNKVVLWSEFLYQQAVIWQMQFFTGFLLLQFWLQWCLLLELITAKYQIFRIRLHFELYTSLIFFLKFSNEFSFNKWKQQVHWCCHIHYRYLISHVDFLRFTYISCWFPSTVFITIIMYTLMFDFEVFHTFSMLFSFCLPRWLHNQMAKKSKGLKCA